MMHMHTLPRLFALVFSLSAWAAYHPAHAGAPATPTKYASPAQAPDLMAARSGFKTSLVPSRLGADGAAAKPPAKLYTLVRYPAPAGELASYLSPDPHDGKKHPAVVWLHGGWGGIDSWLWDRGADSQAPYAFRDANFVVMMPSRRGENDNPGKMEFFYGEVDDTLAAIDYLAALPYVDAQRIYVAGHSTGGTLAILTAMASAKPRAVFSFGGRLDMQTYAAQRAKQNMLPFDQRNKEEVRLRNPLEFAGSLKTPLYFFEGESGATEPQELQAMASKATAFGKPFHGYLIKGADHFTALQPLLEWLSQQLQRDAGSVASTTFTAPLDPSGINVTGTRGVK